MAPQMGRSSFLADPQARHDVRTEVAIGLGQPLPAGLECSAYQAISEPERVGVTTTWPKRQFRCAAVRERDGKD
jgi:hypothetical protein